MGYNYLRASGSSRRPRRSQRKGDSGGSTESLNPSSVASGTPSGFLGFVGGLG